MTIKEAKVLNYFSKNQIPVDIPSGIKPEIIRALKSQNLLSVNIIETQASITDAGISALSEYRDQRSDRRWTRGLAIAALIISLFALLLEFDDRGFFGDIFHPSNQLEMNGDGEQTDAD